MRVIELPTWSMGVGVIVAVTTSGDTGVGGLIASWAPAASAMSAMAEAAAIAADVESGDMVF
jgi:hypothetical protein